MRFALATTITKPLTWYTRYRNTFSW